MSFLLLCSPTRWGARIGSRFLAAFSLLGCSLAISEDAEAARIYVNHAVSGGNGDGTAWEHAYDTLQHALTASRANSEVDEIWVARGTYRPDSGADRSASFALDGAGVQLYGGFSGDETSLDQRDYAAHLTILSGDIGTAEDHSDNSYRIVTVPAGAASGLDGFTLSHGRADGAAAGEQSGGGIYNESAQFELVNCRISGNTATLDGGGIYTATDMRWAVNCVLAGNQSDRDGGGLAVASASGTLHLLNCTVAGNRASAGSGGGLYLAVGSTLNIQNSIVGATPRRPVLSSTIPRQA